MAGRLEFKNFRANERTMNDRLSEDWPFALWNLAVRADQEHGYAVLGRKFL
jgi:hypothetical protein